MTKRGHGEEEMLRLLREGESGDRSAVSTASVNKHSIGGRKSTPDSDSTNCASFLSCEMRTGS